MSSTNQAQPTEERDALVIGGNMQGITLAYLLGQYGYRTTLVERAPFLGGIDGSFENSQGRIFDFGVHALDHGRNEFVSNLFERAVKGRFRRLPKRRSLLLRGQLIPYNSPPEDWPGELRALLKPGRIVDDIGSDPPTRARLGEVYGPAFADFVFDEVLASYPAEDRQREYGVDESRLLANIYPWFFPRVERVRREDTTHHRYQSKVRAIGGEHVIYPEEGGFNGFALGLAEQAREAGVEVLVGARDLSVEMDAERRRVEHVVADGRRYSASRVYWCGPPKVLLDLLGEESFDATPETFILASFQFERPVLCQDLELLGGDPRHLIKRASFPGKLQGGTRRPRADRVPLPASGRTEDGRRRRRRAGVVVRVLARVPARRRHRRSRQRGGRLRPEAHPDALQRIRHRGPPRARGRSPRAAAGHEPPARPAVVPQDQHQHAAAALPALSRRGPDPLNAMHTSHQDRHYLEVEADAFHERNHAAADTTELRPYKRRIAERLERAGVRPQKMLEFGCAFGDLLNHYAVEFGTEAHGVEPSSKAVAKGLEAFEGRARASCRGRWRRMR